jgi:Baseplate J-like protein
MSEQSLTCRNDLRHQQLLGRSDWTGIDDISVSEGGATLTVTFFGAAPEWVGPEHVRIEGGRRVRNIAVVDVSINASERPDLDSTMTIRLDRAGDLSTYRLVLLPPAHEDPKSADRAEPRIDPRYAGADFQFPNLCADGSDCAPECPHDADDAAPSPIAIDYLARDYAALRETLLTRLSLILPEWTSRSPADIGVTLVELLADAGDRLAYYQDAVATEAYLSTARLRRSVARHLRLVDYHMDEGSNARTLVALDVNEDCEIRPERVAFLALSVSRTAEEKENTPLIVTASDFADDPPGEVFEIVGPGITAREARSKMEIHTWGEDICTLPKGSVSATLAVDNEAAHLAQGDILIFEEVKGTRTGIEADADPSRRWPVRITSCEPGEDELLGKPIVEIRWAREDALPFPFRLSVRLPEPDCGIVKCVTVVRGNVVPVDHGRTRSEPLPLPEEATEPECCPCPDSVIEARRSASTFSPVLSRFPLVHAADANPNQPAAAFLFGPFTATSPALWVEETPPRGRPRRWSAVPDLLAAPAGAAVFAVEVDEDGRATLRFRQSGDVFAPESEIRASYRVGGGTRGNIGPGSIRHILVLDGALPGLTRVRNPLPGMGGRAAETVSHARAVGPNLTSRPLARAVTAEDYGSLARRTAGVASAHCDMLWTGAWYEARVAVDPSAGPEAESELAAQCLRELEPFRRIGHDLTVRPAALIALDIALSICVKPDYPRGSVMAAVRKALTGAGKGSGHHGLLHATTLTFGAGIHQSAIVAAAMAVEGVESAEVTRLQPMGDPAGAVPDTLRFAPHEIPRLDDASSPENGRLRIKAGGGL